MGRNHCGPEARGNAPAGPGKLSAGDGSSPTPGRIDRQAAQPEPAVTAIVVHPVADKPAFFGARLVDGDRMFAPSRTPFCDAARQLLDLGCDPAAVLVMKHAGSAVESLRAAIGVAAALTVEESAHGPVFRRWRTGSPSAVEAPSRRLGDPAPPPPRSGPAVAMLTVEPPRLRRWRPTTVDWGAPIERPLVDPGRLMEQAVELAGRHRLAGPLAGKQEGVRKNV
jgi:hypothetical protein